MKPLLFLFTLITSFCALAQEETLTEVPLGQPGELKLIHVCPNPNFQQGVIKYSTTNEKLNVSLKPGRYYYRYRSNSNVQRAISKSGKIVVEIPEGIEATKTEHSIEWKPPIDPTTKEKIPFFWTVKNSKGDFIVRDQVITEENPTVVLLHGGTYYWTMTDEIGASWTVPKQFYVNPFPPASVHATVNKDRSVDISWKASPNLEGFVVKVFDEENYEVFSSTLGDRFVSLHDLPGGSYKVNVHGTLTMNGKYGADAEPTFDLISKPVSTTFEVPPGANLASPLIILSPVDRINFEGQKYIFSWHVKHKNQPKKYRLQVKGRDASGQYNDIKQVDVTTTYDESIFQTLPLGNYKFRVAALNEKDEPIPGWSDKAEFTIESKIGEAKIGKVALNNVSFGPEASLMTYTSVANSTSNSVTATMIGLFARLETNGKGDAQSDSYPYWMKEVRGQIFTRDATTLTNGELTIGTGTTTSPSQAGWITRYGLHGSLLRVPDLSATTTGQINFLSLRPRLELSQVRKYFSFQFNFEVIVPFLQFSDTMTATQDPLGRIALGYRAMADMQFPFSWPWSAGGQISYERNDFHYRSPETTTLTDSTLTGFNVKLYLSYPY